MWSWDTSCRARLAAESRGWGHGGSTLERESASLKRITTIWIMMKHEGEHTRRSGRRVVLIVWWWDGMSIMRTVANSRRERTLRSVVVGRL